MPGRERRTGYFFPWPTAAPIWPPISSSLLRHIGGLKPRSALSVSASVAQNFTLMLRADAPRHVVTGTPKQKI